MSPVPDLSSGSSSGSQGKEWPGSVQRMLAIGRLREQAFSGPEWAAVWRKAVESARDAELPDMSLDGALRSAYDAGHLACLALLASHGLRPGGGPGHHEMAFAGAAALVEANPALATVLESYP